jgi:Mrp family chromosome partitioning ATPase
VRPPLFDESLGRLVEAVKLELKPKVLEQSVALRDASGRLSLFVADDLDEARLTHLAELAGNALGPYGRADRLVVGCKAPGAGRILRDSGARSAEVGGVTVRYVDRRIVGADWLGAPAEVQTSPPRFVFASLKGGVGRSTALSVVAAEQARKGRNVLVVDLDLEAPGIGSMLLTEDRRPRLGVLDYMVERNLAPFDRTDLDDLVGTSGLTEGAGLVDVAPVAGRQSLAMPENYLAKLSRAMVEELTTDASPVSVAGKLRALLSALEERRRYDLVLVDSRAGLAEIAAGPLLALGASVLFFGTAQTQTLEGLRFLFAHLRSLVPGGAKSPWENLRMVHAKAHLGASVDRFRDELWELFTEYLYEEQEGLDGFNFDANDPDAPHNPLPIPLDSAFADWDPAESPGKLAQEYYARTFQGLLAFVDDIVTTGGA